MEEYQRAQRRQLAAEQRTLREHARAQAAAMRAQARQQRESWRAYQQWREQEAARVTAELDQQVASLRGVLGAVVGALPLRVASTEVVYEFPQVKSVVVT